MIEHPVWIEKVVTMMSEQTGMFYPVVKRGAYVESGMKAIYSSEQVQKSRPRYWRDRFINEQIKRLEALTAKPSKLGRPKNSGKDCLRKEDDANDLKAEVILAVENLYQGKSDGKYRCQHARGSCSGLDVGDISISLAASYLNKSAGTLRNQYRSTT